MSGLPTRIQSVARATTLLEFVALNPDGRTVRDVADELGVRVSTAYHLINTLLDAGYLMKSENRRYQLGPRIGLLAEGFLAQISVPNYLMDQLRHLAQRTGETAYVSGWRYGEAMVMSVVEGHRAVRVAGVHIGYAELTHARAAGKILLAMGPPGMLERYVASHSRSFPSADRSERVELLRRELQQIRNHGYAIDDEGVVEGVSCIAAPADDDGTVALCISVPAERYRASRDDLISTVVEIADLARSYSPASITRTG